MKIIAKGYNYNIIFMNVQLWLFSFSVVVKPQICIKLHSKKEFKASAKSTISLKRNWTGVNTYFFVCLHVQPHNPAVCVSLHTLTATQASTLQSHSLHSPPTQCANRLPGSQAASHTHSPPVTQSIHISNHTSSKPNNHINSLRTVRTHKIVLTVIQRHSRKFLQTNSLYNHLATQLSSHIVLHPHSQQRMRVTQSTQLSSHTVYTALKHNVLTDLQKYRPPATQSTQFSSRAVYTAFQHNVLRNIQKKQPLGPHNSLATQFTQPSNTMS